VVLQTSMCGSSGDEDAGVYERPSEECASGNVTVLAACLHMSMQGLTKARRFAEPATSWHLNPQL